MSNQQIIAKLENQGYNSQQVAEAMNQLGIKNNIESGSQNKMQPSLLDEDIPVPSPPQSEQQPYVQQNYQYPQQQIQMEPQAFNLSSGQSDVQEIVETIVEERWQRFSDSMTDFEIWKSRINDEIISIKQEVIRANNRFDILQKSVLGKVDEYNRNISDVNSEMKALEKVFQNIINPLTSNIKELSRITKELKEK